MRVINGTESPIEISLVFPTAGSQILAIVGKYDDTVIEIVGFAIKGVPECVELIEPCLLACIQELDEPWQYTRLLAHGQILCFPARIIVDGKETSVSIEFRRIAA